MPKQVYYSLESDPAYCAKTIVAIVRHDLLAEGQTARPEKAAYDLGFDIGQAIGDSILFGWMSGKKKAGF